MTGANDMSHSGKAQLLLSSIFLPTSKVTVKLCFLQALGFPKGAHMHLFTCHKYTDTFLLLSDKNPGKSQSKTKLLLHQQLPLKARQIALHEWRWSLNCWDLGEAGGKSYTLAASLTQIFLLLTLIFLEFCHRWEKNLLLLFRSSGGPVQYLGFIGFFWKPRARFLVAFRHLKMLVVS